MLLRCVQVLNNTGKMKREERVAACSACYPQLTHCLLSCSTVLSVSMMYSSNTAFMALNGCCFACVPVCFVSLWGLICWNCSHMFVSACSCAGAHAIICFILRDSICAWQRQRSAQRLGSACWGELLDLSCQPFTHNVSFMNASCADLIPVTAE